MRVHDLWIYPVKSCRGIAVGQAEVTAGGLLGDRQWMIVDAEGKFLTQRAHPRMTQIGVDLNDDQLVLRDCSGVLDPITLPRDGSGKPNPVQVWKTRTLALDQGEEIADWLTALLETPCRLVRQSPDHPRPTNPEYAPGGTVSFADGYPLLLTTTASLAALNSRIQASRPTAAPVAMMQFRPNVVVDLDLDRAFEEDHWKSLAIGAVRFDAVKACDRCIVTTTHQESGDRDPHKEPLNTLSTFRRFNGKLLFGENLVPRTRGVLHRGDPVRVLATDAGPRI